MRQVLLRDGGVHRLGGTLGDRGRARRPVPHGGEAAVGLVEVRLLGVDVGMGHARNLCASGGEAAWWAPMPGSRDFRRVGSDRRCTTCASRQGSTTRCEPRPSWRRRPGVVKGDVIAQRQDIPAKFLENILADLRHAAWWPASGRRGWLLAGRRRLHRLRGRHHPGRRGPAGGRPTPAARTGRLPGARSGTPGGVECGPVPHCGPSWKGSPWPTLPPGPCRRPRSCCASQARGCDADVAVNPPR